MSMVRASLPRLAVFRVAMGQGGADRVTLTLLKGLAGSFTVTLVLVRRAGEWLADVPPESEVVSLDAGRLRAATLPLAAYLRRAAPDVILSLDSGGNVPAVLAHRLAGRPGRLVLSERNILFNGGRTPRRLLEVVVKRALYRFADRVLAVSGGVRSDLLRYLRLPPQRVRVVFNPVVDESIAAQAAAPIDHPWFAGGPPVIMTAGRLVPQKDHLTLLGAFAALRREMPGRLFILGVGPMRGRLEAEAGRLGVAADVAFSGFDKNPFRYMARAAVFALSSRNEGLPGVLIQAMACGTAVVATDCHAGPAEIVDAPGVNGLLVPVGDSAALAGALHRLLVDDQARRAMGEAGRRVVGRFDVATVTARYRDELLGTVA
jgi:glycosyltransferase involved in cell wall biosynthesis